MANIYDTAAHNYVTASVDAETFENKDRALNLTRELLAETFRLLERFGAVEIVATTDTIITVHPRVDSIDMGIALAHFAGRLAAAQADYTPYRYRVMTYGDAVITVWRRRG